jgi:hypothetical protein
VVSVLIHWPAGPEFTEYRHNFWLEDDKEAAKLVAQLMNLHEALQLLYDASAKEIRRLGIQVNRESMKRERGGGE